eukprot:TRINITY_DN25444_c0_g1_i1.p1 TRINITY_DN25444_c0_g1~~TRINITY_DN25444_c0_g1_i1.p1  ORF type:complete len:224 (+),score=58.36 TRINITY_DN25444_c0_g1_i1:279-950(+)
MSQFSGFENLDKYKPWAFRCTFCTVTMLGIVGMGLLGMDIVKEIHEQREWTKMTGQLNVKVACNATGEASVGVEERTLGENCDGEPCPDEYRAWVGVRYRFNGDITTKCYSHIDDSYERSSTVARKFIDSYPATINAPYLCCIDPSYTSHARFCTWDTPDTHLSPKVLAFTLSFIGLWLLYLLGIFLVKRTSCLDQLADHLPLDDPGVELADREWDDENNDRE